MTLLAIILKSNANTLFQCPRSAGVRFIFIYGSLCFNYRYLARSRFCLFPTGKIPYQGVSRIFTSIQYRPPINSPNLNLIDYKPAFSSSYYHILPPYQKKCPLSFWYQNSPFSKIIFSGLLEPKKLSLVSLERVESWLSNDTKLNFFGSRRPEKIIFEKGELWYQKESGHIFGTEGV